MDEESDRHVIRGSDGSNDSGRTDGGSFRLVQRDRLGLGEIAVGISDNPPGSGAPGILHRHSCGEVFVVYEGRGVYIVGDTEVVAGPGDMVIVPPSIWHSFRPDDGASGLRHVAVHDAGEVDIEVSTRPGEVFPL